MSKPLKNQLPKGFNSWYALFIHMEKRGLISIENKPTPLEPTLLPNPTERFDDDSITMIRYDLDFDYIKARAFEEIANQQFDFEEFDYIRKAVTYAQSQIKHTRLLNRLNEMLFDKYKFEQDLRRMHT